MVSTVFGGHFIERFGYVPSFLVTASLYLVSTLLYLAYFWKPEYLKLGTEGSRAGQTEGR
jgi:predicted MFS family arabinose efflux permease